VQQGVMEERGMRKAREMRDGFKGVRGCGG
jgi:hypothetical protein